MTYPAQNDLSREEKEKILNWLNKNNVNDVCPICRKQAFYPDLTRLYSIDAHTPTSELLKQNIKKPLMAMSCQVCGYIAVFDVVKIFTD